MRHSRPGGSRERKRRRRRLGPLTSATLRTFDISRPRPPPSTTTPFPHLEPPQPPLHTQNGLSRCFRHERLLAQRPQDADYAPGAAGGRHAERAHARRGASFCRLSRFNIRSLMIYPETQRALLRALRPQARCLPLQRRRNLLHILHGEVHVRLEHRLEAIRCPDTAGVEARRHVVME